MLSAIVLAPRNEADVFRVQDAVVRTLSVLVGAAVADLVRDACVVGPPGLLLEKIADHAGCDLVEDADPGRALQAALGRARCDHILILKGGYAPAFGFIDEMSDWLAARGAHDAAALRCEAETLAQRLFPALAPAAGLIARKSDCLAAGASEPVALGRKLHAKTLRTRARRLV
jgi:hypothetical protein